MSSICAIEGRLFNKLTNEMFTCIKVLLSVNMDDWSYDLEDAVVSTE